MIVCYSLQDFIWPEFKRKEIFYCSPNLTRWKDDRYFHFRNTTEFGNENVQQNLTEIADKFFECLTILWGWRLKG